MGLFSLLLKLALEALAQSFSLQFKKHNYCADEFICQVKLASDSHKNFFRNVFLKLPVWGIVSFLGFQLRYNLPTGLY